MGYTNGCAWLEDGEIVLEKCTPKQAFDMHRLEMVMAMYIRMRAKYYSIRELQYENGIASVNLNRQKRGIFTELTATSHIWCEMDGMAGGHETNRNKIVNVIRLMD